MATTVSIATPPKPLPAPSDAHLKLHHRKNGFRNPWSSWRDPPFGRIIWWATFGRLTGFHKEVDTITATVPIRKPNFLPTRETAKLRATWLGHACYYLEFPGGLRVLFDPVFTQRCSPFSWLGPKRYTDMPCDVDELPYVDVVVISHNHYDHLSYPTLVRIKEKYKDVRFFVPLGIGSWFQSSGFGNVVELDWWEDREVVIESGDAKMEAKISCLPCQHSSARGAFDRSKTLWASWSVESGGKNMWFGGDTGYRSVPALSEDVFDYGEEYASIPHCPAFEQIGELRGPFDLGLIPIGAYDPRWFMSPMHANPYDSVNIFVDTKCKRALGIHWGTWVLTTEEILEPPMLLRKALKWKGLQEDGLFEVCDVGESREY